MQLFSDTDTETIDFQKLLDDLPPLRVRRHERVKEVRRKLQETIKEKERELDDLRKRYRTAQPRRNELEEEFREAKAGDGERAPDEVLADIEAIDELEDNFRRKVLDLKTEIDVLEDRLDTAAEDTLADRNQRARTEPMGTDRLQVREARLVEM